MYFAFDTFVFLHYNIIKRTKNTKHSFSVSAYLKSNRCICKSNV